ncbi:unnamed protein product [Rhodiola kirilowii]
MAAASQVAVEGSPISTPCSNRYCSILINLIIVFLVAGLLDLIARRLTIYADMEKRKILVSKIEALRIEVLKCGDSIDDATRVLDEKGVELLSQLSSGHVLALLVMFIKQGNFLR